MSHPNAGLVFHSRPSPPPRPFRSLTSMSAHPNQMTCPVLAFFSAPSGSQSAPVLSAPASLAPSTSSSSSTHSHTHNGIQQLPFVGSDGSGGMQHPNHSPMQNMWSSNNNFTTFSSQQQSTLSAAAAAPAPGISRSSTLTLHSQMSLPAAGRLSSHESSSSHGCV